MRKLRVFISYSHHDEKQKMQIVQHLKVPQKLMLDPWDDRSIKAGQEWLPEINKAIDNCDVALLLISADFLTSEFICRKEVPKLLKRRIRDGILVIPFIIRPCAWREVRWLQRIQVRPTDGKALANMSDAKAETVITGLVNELVTICDNLRNRRPDVTVTSAQYLDAIYNCYKGSRTNTPICTCTSSWPIDDRRGKVLFNLKANSVCFIGPINCGSQFLGVLWRLYISQNRSKPPQFEFYHREQPGMKFVVVGNDVVVSDSRDYTPSQTGKRWCDFPVMADLLREFFNNLLVQAIPLRTHLRALIKTHLTSRRTRITTLSELLEQLTHGATSSSFQSKRQQTSLSAFLETILPEDDLMQVTDTQGIPHILLSDRAHLPEKQLLPALRIIVTPDCDLKCVYCPKPNENFFQMDKILSESDISRFIGIAQSIGFSEFRFSGGEPLQAFSTVERCIEENHLTEPPNNFYICTNGVRISNYIERLSKLPNLTLKVSLDSIDQNTFQKITRHNHSTLQNILTGLAACRHHNIKVGINTVVTKHNIDNAHTLVDFCKEQGFYLKLMDVNSYSDLSPDFFQEHFVSMAPIVACFAKQYGVHENVRTVGGYGIPMSQFKTGENSFVRIKDSHLGSTYSPFCTEHLCPHFPCQEGIYQLSLTSDGKLKVCRHQLSTSVSVADPLRRHDDEAVKAALIGQIRRFFKPCFSGPAPRLPR